MQRNFVKDASFPEMLHNAESEATKLRFCKGYCGAEIAHTVFDGVYYLTCSRGQKMAVTDERILTPEAHLCSYCSIAESEANNESELT